SIAERAHARGITVLFDPNWRPALWRSPSEAVASHAAVLPHVDWYLCGEEEGHILFGSQTEDDLAEKVRAAGARNVAVRVGSRGAVVQGRIVAPAQISPVVDEVGAGDGFAAGFAYGLLNRLGPDMCARWGNFVASGALRGTGDWEMFPF